MQKGDISNAMPKRYLVHINTIRTTTPYVKKVLGIIPIVKKEHAYNNMILSRFYLHANNIGDTLELFSTDGKTDELEATMEYLDRVGTNPFRYFTAYESVDHLVAELPYRPELRGVVDIPERLLRYGSWGMAYTDLFGGPRD